MIKETQQSLKPVVLQPVYFAERTEKESVDFDRQLEKIESFYGELIECLPAVPLGSDIPSHVDMALFPQLIFGAFRHDDKMKAIPVPILVITSRFGTVEMWDWEIVTYMKDLGMDVYAPYTVEIAKIILRTFAAKKQLKGGKFLVFQDTPGEGMQANIFKRFFWWEDQAVERLEQILGCQFVFSSWKALSDEARAVSDEEAASVSNNWSIAREGLSDSAFYKAVKIYIAVKNKMQEVGDVLGVGSNCLNESFHCDTTPCLAWTMLFEQDNILFACEGDILTLASTFVFYRALEAPMLMTNIYPFLVGMAALAHEKITEFPDVVDGDNCALAVHCGYFGLMPRAFSRCWTLKPKVLEIVNDDAVMVDCEMKKGPVTLAKISTDLNQLSVIKADLEAYVQYPGSDCRNGGLLRFNDGHEVMEHLSSHHAMIIEGEHVPALKLIAIVFNWDISIV